MTDPTVRVQELLQQLQGGAVPVPVVKTLSSIAVSLGLSLDELVNLEELRVLCLQSLEQRLRTFAEGEAISLGYNLGTFCAHFRGQVLGLQPMLGEHDDFRTFLQIVEAVADRVYPG